MLEPEQILDDGQLTGGGGFGPLSVERLLKANGWINFLSIFFYAFGTILGFFLLYGLAIDGGRMGGEEFLIILFVIAMVGSVFIIGRQLQALASATRQLRYGGATPRKTTDICKTLRRTFATFGIMVVVIIILILIGVIVADSQSSYYGY